MPAVTAREYTEFTPDREKRVKSQEQQRFANCYDHGGQKNIYLHSLLKGLARILQFFQGWNGLHK